MDERTKRAEVVEYCLIIWTFVCLSSCQMHIREMIYMYVYQLPSNAPKTMACYDVLVPLVVVANKIKGPQWTHLEYQGLLGLEKEQRPYCFFKGYP